MRCCSSKAAIVDGTRKMSHRNFQKTHQKAKITKSHARVCVSMREFIVRSEPHWCAVRESSHPHLAKLIRFIFLNVVVCSASRTGVSRRGIVASIVYWIYCYFILVPIHPALNRPPVQYQFR